MKKLLSTIFTIAFTFALIAITTEPVVFHTVANETITVDNRAIFTAVPSFGERIASFTTQMMLEHMISSITPTMEVPNSIAFAPQPIEIVTDTPTAVWTPKNDTTTVYTQVASPLSPTITTSTAPVVVNASAPVVTTSPSSEKTLAALIPNLAIEDPSHMLSDAESAHIQQTLATMFQKFPSTFTNRLKNLTLKTAKDGPRGLAGSNTMILRVSDMDDSELVGVAIHELGHVVDLGYLVGHGQGTASGFMDGSTEVASDDLSSSFYAISWKNAKDRITNGTEGFVSGYASSDPFEDFAETFNYYVLHADEFKVLAKGNLQLAKKYEFMKNHVFDGEEFTHTTASRTTYTSTRPWDTTVLSYDWDWYKGVSF